MDSSSNEDGYISCIKCGQVFSNVCHLTEHIQRVHSCEGITENEDVNNSDENCNEESDENEENQMESAFYNFRWEAISS